MKKLYINGRFLTQSLTGTQRFAAEIVRALDKALANHPDAPQTTLLTPKNAKALESLTRIKQQTIGTRQGHAWEQWDLYKATKKAPLLSLSNSGPVLHNNQLTVIHDAMVYRTPENFSFLYKTFHQTLGRLLSVRSKLATVSHFSAQELSTLLNVKLDEITVVYNGHEHILRHQPDTDILNKLKLTDRPFFYFVGSPTPNKNLLRAIEAFKKLNRKDTVFVIVGAAKANVFNGGIDSQPENIILTGRLTDGEIVALYQNATALIFPSLYEGFGIPPLEAMVHGCPVLASTIPPIKEVCAGAVLYFNPLNTDDMASKMKDALDNKITREALITKGAARCKDFTWQKSAEILLKEVLR